MYEGFGIFFFFRKFAQQTFPHRTLSNPRIESVAFSLPFPLYYCKLHSQKSKLQTFLKSEKTLFAVKKFNSLEFFILNPYTHTHTHTDTARPIDLFLKFDAFYGCKELLNKCNSNLYANFHIRDVYLLKQIVNEFQALSFPCLDFFVCF